MASSFVIINTDLRRVTVKAPAGGYMIDVLEDACAKLKLSNSENFQLKHNNKPINLTDPIRAAGLPQGAKLELVVKSKSASAVTVALRLPQSEARLGLPNNRVSAKVRSDTTLWRLLRQLEEAGDAKKKGLNITARAVPQTAATTASPAGSSSGPDSGSGQLYWEAPVLKFAGRELTSLDDFRKTLSQVGIDTGSQLIMLEFRRTDQTLAAALESIQSTLEKVDADAASDAKLSATTAAPATATTTAPTDNAASEPAADAAAPSSASVAAPSVTEQPASEPAAAASSSTAMEVDKEDENAHLRPIQVWLPPTARSGGMPAATALRWGREQESGLLPSIAQMKAHQKHLEEAGRNKRLKSDDELAVENREREVRAAAVNKVDVRVRFPDGYTVLWSLPNGSTGATLHSAVRGVLSEAASAQPFRLAPPMARGAEIHDRNDVPKHDLVRGYGMKGGVVVHYLRATDVAALPSGKTYIKTEIISAMAQDIVIPQTAEIEDEDDEAEAKAASSSKGKSSSGGDPTKKLSKFLRLSKK